MKDKYITVTQLTRYIKFQLDNDKNLNHVFLRGEISNFKAHSRGHFYFTIKDEFSRVNAVMFSFNAKSVKFMPEDGMKVLVTGKISVFESTGNYQIYVDEMVEDGVGNLHIAFEQLKEKLSNEGLFDEAHKKSIPKIATKVGVITAPTGAAIRDILSTIKRRFPICEVILFPSLVQGEEAKDDIVKKLSIADNYGLDLIILGRGGGSIEDLWPFNEEIVARAVYAAKTPIISAVGHEIDFTICDFVADLRAETPTGAAERAVPNLLDILNYMDQLKIRALKTVKSILDNYHLRLNKLSDSYVLKNPLSLYEVKEQKLDMYIDRLHKMIIHMLDQYKTNMSYYTFERISFCMDNILKEQRISLSNLIDKLDILNPMNALKRGYSIVKKDGKCCEINKIVKNDSIEIEMHNGKIIGIVEEVKIDA